MDDKVRDALLEIEAELEAEASEHLSVGEWWYFFLGGPSADRSHEELVAHIVGCPACKGTLQSESTRNPMLKEPL